ncbi:MAG: hypothetical protein COB02_02785 [Candidatus Cloacimonadota bacterium]|nr:MAG: hypothetical protein COB02_02785 [Candidatus Cloacimonadota bacterium]
MKDLLLMFIIKLFLFLLLIQSDNAATKSIIPNGLTLHPTYKKLKGFKRGEGLVISYVDLNNKSETQKDMWNFYYSKLVLTNFSTFRITQLIGEWENRTYGEGGAYSSAAVGINRLIIGNSIKSHMQSLGTNAKHAFKPYLEFRMGYKLADQGMFGIPIAGQLSYTLSDDYRFKSNLPNGYHKIPLKGFKADISFRF